MNYASGLDTHIEDFDCSVRVYNRCKDARISTIRELICLTEDELRDKSFGRLEIKEIKKNLAEAGLSLTVTHRSDEISKLEGEIETLKARNRELAAVARRIAKSAKGLMNAVEHLYSVVDANPEDTGKRPIRARVSGSQNSGDSEQDDVSSSASE